jgi:hypothetical protein
MKTALTVFKNLYDNKTDLSISFPSFEAFEAVLYYLFKLKGYKPKKGERVSFSSPLISPAIYNPNTTRANVNVIEWCGWAALDVDNHQFKGDLESELSNLYPDSKYVCYSTASSTKDKPKFRLVFPLSRSVSAAEIKHFWFALNSKFGKLGDAQTKDLSRTYYIPGEYPNAFNFIFSHDGNSIDVNSLLKEYPYTESKAVVSFIDRLPQKMQEEVIAYREQKLKSNKKEYKWTSYSNCPFVNKNLINEYKSISTIDGTGRYSMIYKIMVSIATSAVKHGYPISEYEIVDIIKQLDILNLYRKRPLNLEASRAIEFAYRNV